MKTQTDPHADLASERRRLRIGHGPWTVPADPLPWSKAGCSRRADVIIVGGGITGALLSEHLTARGMDVVVIDRLPPGLGSTAASTAMLQWEIDRSVSELAEMKGLETAAWAYRASFSAVQGLAALVARLKIPCHFKWRTALFLAAPDAPDDALRTEHAFRQRISMPSQFLDRRQLMERYGIDRPAAIVSTDAAEVDPLFLSRALLLKAVNAGASLIHGDVEDYDFTHRGGAVRLAGGIEIEARNIVLATGYALPDFLTAPAHKESASWAAVTAPDTPLAFWQDRSLIWEDNTPYLYARTTADGRILVGGEDEPVAQASERDALTETKAEALHAKLQALWGRSVPPFESAWSAAFGETSDGLPLIGALPGQSRGFGAYGYGGNGITFSYLASRLIASAIAGERGDWTERLAIDRPAD